MYRFRLEEIMLVVVVLFSSCTDLCYLASETELRLLLLLFLAFEFEPRTTYVYEAKPKPCCPTLHLARLEV